MDTDEYQKKIALLKPFCGNLKSRAEQYRQVGEVDAANKLEVMVGVLEERIEVPLDYLLNLEKWINQKAVDLLQASVADVNL